MKPGIISIIIMISTSCMSFNSEEEKVSLLLPFLKNSPQECYYLDEFMPIPNNLVTGQHGALKLRYYNYTNASYKDWRHKQIMLAFYSDDERCWSLYEEQYSKD